MSSKPKVAPSITDEDFEGWRANPITEAVFAHLKAMQQSIHHTWAGALGGDIPSDPMPTHLLRIELTAKLEFIEDMLRIELRDIQEQDEGTSTTAVVPPKRAGARPRAAH